MNSDSNYPIGEVTWVRRGIINRDASFFFRELTRGLMLFLVFIGSFAAPLILIIPNRSVSGFWLSFSVWAATTAIIMPMLIVTALSVLPRLSICPIWLYAEQISPIRLTVYRFLKPKRSVALAGSRLDTKQSRPGYINATLTDSVSSDSITLPQLTPQEFERVEEYWLHANWGA